VRFYLLVFKSRKLDVFMVDINDRLLLNVLKKLTFSIFFRLPYAYSVNKASLALRLWDKNNLL